MMFGTPEEALTRTKKKNLLYAIKIYCHKNKINIDSVRVDFISITHSFNPRIK